jgi:hypothetical protein
MIGGPRRPAFFFSSFCRRQNETQKKSHAFNFFFFAARLSFSPQGEKEMEWINKKK